MKGEYKSLWVLGIAVLSTFLGVSYWNYYTWKSIGFDVAWYVMLIPFALFSIAVIGSLVSVWHLDKNPTR